MPDDGSWTAKAELIEKAQTVAQEFGSTIKAVGMNTEPSEIVFRAAKQFSTLDLTAKNTALSLNRMSLITKQLQETNYAMLDNLRTVNKAVEGMQIYSTAPTTIAAPGTGTGRS